MHWATDPILSEPRYTIAEAARLASASPATLRRWAAARFPESTGRSLSFLELVELALLRALAGRVRLSPAALVATARNLDQLFGCRHALLTPGARSLPPLHPGMSFIDALDYGEGYIRAWWPRGRTTGVAVDPTLGFGLAVVASTGVRTEILLERFRAGDLVDEIASDFNLSRTEVERALQFEACLAAA